MVSSNVSSRSREKVLGSLRIGRILITGLGGNLGFLEKVGLGCLDHVGLGLTINRSTEQANYREENSVLEWIGRRYMRMQKIRHEEQGFTLIELLIVITLLFHKLRYHSQTRPN